jgi:hypothetical protein
MKKRLSGGFSCAIGKTKSRPEGRPEEEFRRDAAYL